MLGGHRKTMRKIDYCGKPWVAGKAEPISPRVAASLGEPMLGCNIGWTRRGVPFWRTIGQMVRWYHPGRDLDLFPRVAIALTVGKVQPRVPFLPRLCEPTASLIEKWGIQSPHSKKKEKNRPTYGCAVGSV